MQSILKVVQSETFFNVLMWLLVLAVLVGGLYLSNVLSGSSLVILVLLLVIANMASRTGTGSLLILCLSSWFLLGLFSGFFVHWLGY